jgi:RNA polymerase sigma-70 factor (ECF subfamily)
MHSVAQSLMPTRHLAVEALYSTHHGWLSTWLRSRLGNAADAADLAQDTFIRLLQRTDRLELRTPRAFLRTVAGALVIDLWRREELHRAYLETIAHLAPESAPCPQTRQLVMDLLEQIAKMLEGLRPKVREAFLLAQCDGLSHKEISARMGISLRSVERHVADALFRCYQLRYE